MATPLVTMGDECVAKQQWLHELVQRKRWVIEPSSCLISLRPYWWLVMACCVSSLAVPSPPLPPTPPLVQRDGGGAAKGRAAEGGPSRGAAVADPGGGAVLHPASTCTSAEGPSGEGGSPVRCTWRALAGLGDQSVAETYRCPTPHFLYISSYSKSSCVCG